MRAIKVILYVRDSNGEIFDPNFKEKFTDDLLDFVEDQGCSCQIFYNEITAFTAEEEVDDYENDSNFDSLRS